jgi:hypothetical protein
MKQSDSGSERVGCAMPSDLTMRASVCFACCALLLMFIGCRRPSAGETLVPLAGGQEWTSDDGKYRALVPSDWTVTNDAFGHATVARAPGMSNMTLLIFSDTEKPAPGIEEEAKRLDVKAGQDLPPALGATDYRELETHTGHVGGYYAAWRLVGFNAGTVGSLKRLAVVIGTPTGTYHINIMAKEDDFNRSRALFEGIAGSFRSR